MDDLAAYGGWFAPGGSRGRGEVGETQRGRFERLAEGLCRAWRGRGERFDVTKVDIEGELRGMGLSGEEALEVMRDPRWKDILHGTVKALIVDPALPGVAMASVGSALAGDAKDYMVMRETLQTSAREGDLATVIDQFEAMGAEGAKRKLDEVIRRMQQMREDMEPRKVRQEVVDEAMAEIGKQGGWSDDEPRVDQREIHKNA